MIGELEGSKTTGLSVAENIFLVHTKCKCRTGIFTSTKSSQVHNCWNFDYVANSTLRNRRIPASNPSKTKRFNIVIQGYDSLSWGMVKRRMPKTATVLTNDYPNTIRAKKFNVIQHNTRPNLYPLLVGLGWPDGSKKSYILSEKYDGFYNGIDKDKYYNTTSNKFTGLTTEDLPHIFKLFKAANYFTTMFEDMMEYHLFNWKAPGSRYGNMSDFHSRPVFSSGVYKEMADNKIECFGSQSKTEYKLDDWGSDLLEQFKKFQHQNSNSHEDFPLFQFSFTAEIMHDNERKQALADTKTAEYFSKWFNPKHDNDTIFIFMSDHGFRVGGSFGKEQQAKFEHKNPPFFIRFPERFIKEYPIYHKIAVKNMENYIVTFYDLRETLINLVEIENENKKSGGFSNDIEKILTDFRKYYPDNQPNGPGRSLFSENFGVEKNCVTSRIEPGYCNCLNGVPFIDDHRDFAFLRRKKQKQQQYSNEISEPNQHVNSKFQNIILKKLQDNENDIKHFLANKCQTKLNNDTNIAKMNDSCIYWELDKNSIENGIFQISADSINDINLTIELELYFSPKSLDGRFVCSFSLDLAKDRIFDEVSLMENMSMKRLINLPETVVRLQRSGRYGKQYKPCVPAQQPNHVKELREFCACKSGENLNSELKWYAKMDWRKFILLITCVVSPIIIMYYSVFVRKTKKEIKK